MTSAEIRQAFLDFFYAKGHTIVPSAPIVVKDDPTLMFTNAGMNQFKDYFLGNKLPPYGRVADTQKCLRVSGKHNDLEEVGVDTYHHTMFEMLGNWSFGDYFKHEAISWSWELLTEIYKIPKDRLYASVFEGDKKEKLPASKIALEKWKEFLPGEHIVFGNKKDNFWEMGDTGPCGPCSEIHVDCRSDEERKLVPGHTLINKDHPQVIEIWNNVFIQYNRKKDGSLEPLAATHVDTGMGLERLVRVIQNKKSNYDTDIFTGTIAATEKITGKKYDGSDTKEAIAFRVLADHIRAISFTIADGQLPSNTGAGYVIRRILRRAVRYYYSHLGYSKPLLFELVIVLAEQFKNVFPELFSQKDFVGKVIFEEELSFLKTIDSGIGKIRNFWYSNVFGPGYKAYTDKYGMSARDADGGKEWGVFEKEFAKNISISGKEAFELYDTFGFPLDLTQLVASEHNLRVDEAGFKKEMELQKERSRAAAMIDADDWVVVKSGLVNTFLGEDLSKLTFTTGLLRYRKILTNSGVLFQIVLHYTPFYAEGGGQVGDKGWLTFGDERISVIDTKRENNLILHVARELPSTITETVTAIVDKSKRKSITSHHSATHLLHAALRHVLGPHVAQKGSLVNEEHLRFDFSHFAKVSDEEIAAIEKMVNEKIRENIPVLIEQLSKEEALQRGAMALFGEKYGDTVRVVTMDPNYSIELCGGTHVLATGDLGFFKIKNEGAVAAGVRRIEAVCGLQAEQYVQTQLNTLHEVKGLLKNPTDLSKAIDDLLENKTALQKLNEQMAAMQATTATDKLNETVSVVNGIDFFHLQLSVDGTVLKKIFATMKIKERTKNTVLLLMAQQNGKVSVLLGSSQQFTSFDSNKIVKEEIAPLINGAGGGQTFQAMATGTDAGKFDQIVKRIENKIS